MKRIIDNIKEVRAHIPAHVTLVCVSKFQSIEAIRTAYEAGERHFGESRVQELKQKVAALPSDINWHFIGHLQTNKVRQIVPFVHLIQSVDSVRLLEVINAEAARIGRVVDVLLEVHTANEETKSGFLPEELSGVPEMPIVRVCGLMVLPPFFDDPERVRPFFRELRQLAEHLESLKIPQVTMRELSMGMSGDFEAAIEEGATLVRVGTALFGAR